jgi:hypothetical protein
MQVGKMRAQASLDTMASFLIFISALAVSAAAAFAILSASNARIERDLAQKGFADLSSKINDACAMGDGNMRTISLGSKNNTLESQGSKLLFFSGEYSESVHFLCNVSVESGGPSNSFKIENVGGLIVVSTMP